MTTRFDLITQNDSVKSGRVYHMSVDHSGDLRCDEWFVAILQQVVSSAVCVCVCTCVCMCMCVCVRERERERVCVYAREERERANGRERQCVCVV